MVRSSLFIPTKHSEVAHVYGLLPVCLQARCTPNLYCPNSCAICTLLWDAKEILQKQEGFFGQETKRNPTKLSTRLIVSCAARTRSIAFCCCFQPFSMKYLSPSHRLRWLRDDCVHLCLCLHPHSHLHSVPHSVNPVHQHLESPHLKKCLQKKYLSPLSPLSRTLSPPLAGGESSADSDEGLGHCPQKALPTVGKTFTPLKNIQPQLLLGGHVQDSVPKFGERGEFGRGGEDTQTVPLCATGAQSWCTLA